MKKISRPFADTGAGSSTNSSAPRQTRDAKAGDYDDTPFAGREARSNANPPASCAAVQAAAIIDSLRPTAPFDAARIRDYYDRNTPAFVALGQGGALGAIHRAVWAPGIRDRRAAFRYVEDRIAELIRRLPASTPHVVDLGCGIGSSLAYLAATLPILGTGITLSPVQAGLAARRLGEAGLSDRVACIAGDYSNLPEGLAP